MVDGSITSRGPARRAAVLASAYLVEVERLGPRPVARGPAGEAVTRRATGGRGSLEDHRGPPRPSDDHGLGRRGRDGPVPAPGVSKAIGQLESAGVLRPLSESQRNRSWEAVGLLDLLAALEEGR